MLTTAFLRAAHASALDATCAGAPARPSNPFFGVGPISDGTGDEVCRRQRRLAFDRWVTARYRKRDDRGRDIGGYSPTELARSMHRGEPADSILLDMLRSVHRYFGLPRQNRLAVGLGGGHTGFTVCLQHLLSAGDPAQRVFIDTPQPETAGAAGAGFFRQSWAAQVLDLCRQGADRLHFAPADGTIPDAGWLIGHGIRLVIGVGHETTGASGYNTAEMAGLLRWIEADPANHHAIIDATSLLGAMPWPQDIVAGVLEKCCLFMPLQKAIGGIAGYYIASFTPQALALIDRNVGQPGWAIPRQQGLAVPVDPARPVSGPRSTARGPFYDPVSDQMLGGVINTYSLLAFAETTFGLLETERRIGPVGVLNARSAANRATVADWVALQSLFDLVVADPDKRGCAVTLLRVTDPAMADLHPRILARAKQLLGHQGLTHPGGAHEPGLNAAVYINAFPGMPGDFRAWIGGVRDSADILALLENLRYAWLRAKAVVLAEELATRGEVVAPPALPAATDPAQVDAMARLAEDLAAVLGGIRSAGDLARHLPQARAQLAALAAALG